MKYSYLETRSRRVNKSFIILVVAGELECYIAHGQKSLPERNTLAYWDQLSCKENELL
jgi:hypothetical protein